MHLSPRELDKLVLHNAGFLAQKRLARGLRLNHPEAVALIATVLLELIRDGRSVAELMNMGRQLLGRNQVMAGVPEMIHDVQVEGTFPDGSKLVTVHHPIASENGNLALALHGSFLPIPELSRFGPTAVEPVPGTCTIQDGEIEMNAGRKAIELQVSNRGDRPIQGAATTISLRPIPASSSIGPSPTDVGSIFRQERRCGLNPVKPGRSASWRSLENGSFAAGTIWPVAR